MRALFGIATLLLAAPAGGGVPELARSVAELLPEGWELADPSTDRRFEAIALGPELEGGRYVLALSRLELKGGMERLATDAGRKALAAALEAGTTALDVVEIRDNDMLGGPEIHTRLRGPLGDRFEVRFYVMAGPRPRLFTLTGPKAQFEPMHRRLLEIGKGLVARRK